MPTTNPGLFLRRTLFADAALSGGTVIACNALWAVDSVALLLTGRIAPTAWGHAFVVAQALIVAGFAWLQHLGLRRVSGPAAATGLRPPA
jgi:hypothetical protein